MYVQLVHRMEMEISEVSVKDDDIRIHISTPDLYLSLPRKEWFYLKTEVEKALTK